MRGHLPESRRACGAAGLSSGCHRLTACFAARRIAPLHFDVPQYDQAFTQSPVQQISAGVVSYFIGRVEPSLPRAAAESTTATVHDADSAKHVLHRCVKDRAAMRVLRTQLAVVLRNTGVVPLDDVAVVEQVVSLIAQRRLRLLGPYPPALARERVPNSALSTMNVLRRCVGDHYAMRLLRAQLADAVRDAQVPQLSDVAVVNRIVSLVAQGRLQLRGPFAPLREGGGVTTVAEAAPSPAPAPAARPTPQSSSRATAMAAEPSFSPNVDVAALAATLTDAAKDGTPFCEECARAARAA